MAKTWEYMHFYGAAAYTNSNWTFYLWLSDSITQDSPISAGIDFTNDDELIDAWYATRSELTMNMMELGKDGWELVSVNEQPLKVFFPNQTFRSFPSYYFKREIES